MFFDRFSRLGKTIAGTSMTLLLVCLIFYITHPIGQTGEQWLTMQYAYIENISVLAEEMDTVVTLYISDAISEEDFLVHVNVMEQECKILKYTYLADMKNVPIKTGTHTYFTKLGTETVASMYDDFFSILNMLKTDSGDKDALSYKYLAFQQEIQKKVTEYYLTIEYQSVLD